MSNRISRGKMIHLGHGKYVRSDCIVAVEPVDGYYIGKKYVGSKCRSRVLINHPEKELHASRTAKTILRDMCRVKEDHKLVQEETDLARFHGSLNTPTGSGTKVQFLVNQEDQNRAEKQLLINCLIDNDTAKAAIQASPFGKTKFYELTKKYGINIKAFSLMSRESYHDCHNVEG